MNASTKQRIMTASAELFRRQGYNGTGIKQILEGARAPFASLYHFFPGGKEHLGVEVIRSSGDEHRRLVEAVFDSAPDAPSGVRAVFLGAAEALRATDYADACPIGTTALEVASTSEPMRKATAEVFEQWVDAGAKRFRAAGIARGHARELAVALVGALEGGFMLSRAWRTTEALEIAGEMVASAVEDALARQTPPGRAAKGRRTAPRRAPRAR